MIKTYNVELEETHELDIIDLTELIQGKLEESKLKEGFVLVFVPGSTAAITTMEYEPGLKRDIPLALERLFPKSQYYYHEETWHDGNGHSHVRASFVGPSLVIPIHEGKLMLGTWQQPVLIELDNKPRKRRLVLQFHGE